MRAHGSKQELISKANFQAPRKFSLMPMLGIVASNFGGNLRDAHLSINK